MIFEKSTTPNQVNTSPWLLFFHELAAQDFDLGKVCKLMSRKIAGLLPKRHCAKFLVLA